MKFTFQPESRPLAGYTLKRGIARGGFGEVYYAYSDAGKEVAVKLLQHNMDIELRGIQQCLNLRHPNLVAIHDVKTDDDGDHWVVMEYIGGQTLEQALQTQKGPMPIAQIERWLVGLAGGLGYLHDRGIVHRDVKPGNIFWDQGSVKLGDVGLSKFMTPSHRSAHTESVGTVYYMAPEVSYGKYGYEVDIYSVGVMLYEMLSGQLPFDGQSTGEILMKHLSEPPNLNIVPAQFRPMLAAALEKDPKKRTSSMAQLLSDFRLAPARKAITDEYKRQTSEPVAHTPQPKNAEPVPAAPPRQNVFANYPYGSFNGQAPRGNGPLNAPHAVAAQAIRVGTFARGLGTFIGADPVLVQTSINWLPRLPGIVFRGFLLICLFFCILAALGPLTVFGLPIFLPLAIYALLTLPEFRRNMGRHLHDVLMNTPSQNEMPARGKPAPVGVAPTIPPDFPRFPSPAAPPVAVPVAAPIAVPVRQAASPPPAAPAAVPAVRLDRNSQRLAELSSSLCWATVLTVLFAAGTGFFSPLFGDAGNLRPDLGKLGVFTFTTLVAVWSILVISKVTADKSVSNQRRRVINLAAGVVVGSVAWWLSRLLMVELSIGGMDSMVDAIGRQPLAIDREPTWMAFVIFFGLLFAARRWWWHADAQRPAMFRVSSVIGTVLVAAVLPVVFAFPWGWAVTWAAVMSCVVQLSAPWIPVELRVQPGRHNLRGSA